MGVAARAVTHIQRRTDAATHFRARCKPSDFKHTAKKMKSTGVGLFCAGAHSPSQRGVEVVDATYCGDGLITYRE